jgi:hypothetical protein
MSICKTCKSKQKEIQKCGDGIDKITCIWYEKEKKHEQ